MQVNAVCSPPPVGDVFVLAADGKLEDRRPSLLTKLLSSGSGAEPGHSSSSEGEKDFVSPEWDVPISRISVRKSAATRSPAPHGV